MKHLPRNAGQLAVDRKNPQLRVGTKTFAHRYERRKIREQLRHLDWALPEVD
jgi:hypothetical protein